MNRRKAMLEILRMTGFGILNAFATTIGIALVCDGMSVGWGFMVLGTVGAGCCMAAIALLWGRGR